jgi:hypothetical protein
MKTLGLLLAVATFSGCTLFQNHVQADSDAQMRRDSAERQARLKAEGKLNPTELEAVSARMGWVRGDARGLPDALTTEEMERRAKAAEAARQR